MVYGALEDYVPKKEKYISTRTNLLINTKIINEGEQMIINAFKNKIFPMAPTGFEDDVDEDELLRKRHEKDRRLSTIEEEGPEDELYKEIFNVDNKLDSALIRKYFNKGSVLELFNSLRYSQIKDIDGANKL